MDWDKMLSSVFVGGSYCKNVSDENYAFEWLAELRRRGIGWKDAEQLMRKHMTTVQGWKEPYIKDQVAKARERMKVWLSD